MAGLARGDLYQERDLAVTTDFRSVIAEVLRGHLRLHQPAIARVLPGFRDQNSLGGLIRA